MSEQTSESPCAEQAAMALLLQRMLDEQRRARRGRWVWRIFKLLATIAVVVWLCGAIGRAVSSDDDVQPHVGLVRVDGVISSDDEANADALIGALDDAWENPHTVGVVLLINSPGGTPVQAQRVYDEIMRLRKVGGKPIDAVIEDLGASGAYYIASAADHIYASSSSLVGSIGVISAGFGYDEAMKKVGIERRVYTAGSNKDMLDPFRPVSDEQRAHLQAVLNSTHQKFIADVKAGRGDRLHETPDMFSGLVWSGEQAVSLGLVDELKNVDALIREKVKNRTAVVDYTVEKPLFERMSKRIGVTALSALGMDTASHYKPVRAQLP